MDLRLEVRPIDDTLVVGVRGDVDVLSSPRLRDCLKTAVSDGCTDVVLDLSGCHLLDSTGLGVIDATVRTLRRRGGRLAVAGAAERIRRLFAVTKLDRRVSVVGTLEEAHPSPT